MSERSERLDAVDTAWLERALAEVCAGDVPPDLRARLCGASASRRQAAAQAVAAAGAPRLRGRFLAAALTLFGLGVPGALVALHRPSADVSAQEPTGEIALADAAQLAKLLPDVTALSLVARNNARGARLPDMPEYTGLLTDGALRSELFAALGGAAMVAAPFALGEAQAELLLHVGKRVARCRLRLGDDSVTFGTAAFALPDALPAGLGATLRREWQRLTEARVAPRRKVQATSVRELIAAIGSDVAIELIGGPFELRPEDERGELPANAAVTWLDSGGPCLQIQGVHNLHLRGLGDPVRVLGTAPGDVLRFVESTGVWLDGLVLGHKEGLEPACSAPVITLETCRDVTLRDCELFGCGTEGLVADRVSGVALDRCEIHTCRAGVVRVQNGQQLRFAGTAFRDCFIWQSGFSFHECAGVTFADCRVTGMDVNGGDPTATLFDVQMDEAVQFVRGAIRGNRVHRLATSKLLLERQGTDERDNGPDVAPQRGDGLR